MLKQAAELWGYQDTEVDAFDPLVGLLIGACATEIEKISHEIHASHSKVLSRLAKLMTPDVATESQPAHGLINVRSVEAESVMQAHEEIVFKKRLTTNFDVKDEIKEIHFSPTATFKIIDGKVAFLASGHTLFEQNTASKKEVFAEAVMGQELEPSTLWLGVEISNAVRKLEKIAFYFDWKNEPDKDTFYQLLPFTQWFLEDKQLPTQTGLMTLNKKDDNELIDAFDNEFDMRKKMEMRINQLYQHRFISIKNREDEKDKLLVEIKKNYPLHFEKVFDEGDLKNIKEELLWIKIVFPQSFSKEAIQNVYCSINTLPIINRKINKFTFRLQQNINIVPLNTDDIFLNIREVQDSSGNEYHEANPLTRLKNYKAMMYSLRRGNVGRYDERNASETLSYLLDLLRDESAAFSALDRDWLTSEVKKLSQVLARLELKSQETERLDPIAYLLMKPAKMGDTVYLQFWSTNGELANKIPVGSKFENYSGVDIQKNEIELVSMTRGGREKLNTAESLYAYKEAVMTRGRVVTVEDIKAVSWAALGKRIEGVNVKKGVMVDPKPKNGLVRTINVLLTPSKHYQLTQEEWSDLCNDLRLNLERQSTMTYPFRIVLGDG